MRYAIMRQRGLIVSTKPDASFAKPDEELMIEEPARALPAFAKIARMIAPKDMPPWLPAHLEWWHQGLVHDRLVDSARPTKLQTRKRLEELEKAALLLKRELNAPEIRHLLEDASDATVGLSIQSSYNHTLPCPFSRSSITIYETKVMTDNTTLCTA
jgi:hypothetical protein